MPHFNQPHDNVRMVPLREFPLLRSDDPKVGVVPTLDQVLAVVPRRLQFVYECDLYTVKQLTQLIGQ